MSKINRTPPPSTSMRNLSQGQFLSEPDLATSPSYEETNSQITFRNKRLRQEDSPQNQTNAHKSDFASFTKEIKEMLSKWKEDQDMCFASWKREQDGVLSNLVRDVADLRNQCQKIQKSNTDIENGMDFGNQKYEEMKSRLSQFEKEKQANAQVITQLQNQIQDLQLQTRTASLELRNIPKILDEKPKDLASAMMKIAKAVNMDIQEAELRDIYRLPGKPGSTTTRPIVAEFTSVNKRNSLLTSIRLFNKHRQVADKLNTQIIGLTGPNQAVFVDEHLAPTARKLFYQTRLFAKTHNFSCWYSSGRIFLRTGPEEKPIIITSEKCLTADLYQKK